MKLAIFFGGLGYHCDKPLLYYAREVAYESGYTDYINMNYTVTVKQVRGNEERMRQAFAEAFVQAEEALSQVEWGKYENIAFISKSLGTAVAAAYLKKYAGIFQGKYVRNVYLTPLAMTFEAEPMCGIAFSGTKDAWIDLGKIQNLCECHAVELHVIEGTNHSLESEDIWRNMDILKEVMWEIKRYLE